MTLGSMLLELRKGAGFNQPAMSRLLGWSQSKVSRAECNQRQISIEDARAWLDLTNADTFTRDAVYEAVRAQDKYMTDGRYIRFTAEAIDALDDLQRHRPGCDRDLVASEALVFVRDMIVRLGAWRTHPETPVASSRGTQLPN